MSASYPLPKGTRQVTPDYTTDGVTVSYAVPFRFFDPTDLFVGWGAPGVNGPNSNFAQQALGVAYTVSGAGLEAGGVITFVSAPAVGVLRVAGVRTPSRLTSTVNDGALISTALENELDVQEMTLQELRRDVSALQAMLTPAGFTTVFLAWWFSLPTSDPGTGLPFNDNGAMAVSQ